MQARAVIFIVAVIGVFLSLGYVIAKGGLQGTDQYWYVEDTESLMNGKGVQTNNITLYSVVNDTTVVNSGFMHNVPQVYMAVVPALLLGAFNGWLVMNVAFTSLTTFLFFLTLRKFFPSTPSGLIALQFLVMPLTLWLTFQPLAEAFQTLLLTSILYVYYGNTRVSRYFVIGILTVILLLCRNNYVLVVPVVSILLYFEVRGNRGLVSSVIFLGSVLFLFAVLKPFFPDTDNYSYYYIAVSGKVGTFEGSKLMDLLNIYAKKSLDFLVNQFLPTDYRIAVLLPFNLFAIGTIALWVANRKRKLDAPIFLVAFTLLFLLLTTMLAQHQPRYILPFYPLVMFAFFMEARSLRVTHATYSPIVKSLVFTLVASLVLDGFIASTISNQGAIESATRQHYSAIYNETIAQDESLVFCNKSWDFVMPAYILRPRKVFVGSEEAYFSTDRYRNLMQKENIRWLVTRTNHGQTKDFPVYRLLLEREIPGYRGGQPRYLYKVTVTDKTTSERLQTQ